MISDAQETLLKIASENKELADRLGAKTSNLEYFSQLASNLQATPTIYRQRRIRLANAVLNVLPFQPSITEESLLADLEGVPVISTAEHLSPCLNPPNANLLLDHLLYCKANTVRSVISLPAGLVSMSDKTWPRRMYGAKGYENLLNHRYKWACPLMVEPITFESMEKVVQNITADDEGAYRERLLAELSKGWENLQMYWEQLSWINYCCYKLAAEAIDLGELSYLYTPSELLVSKMLQDEMLGNAPMSWVLDALLERPNQIYSDFIGAPCFFERDFERGTFLFWYMDEKKRKHPVVLKDGHVVEPQSGYACSIDRESLQTALKDRHLFPSSGLTMLYAGFYLGLQLLGGGGQIFYLPNLRDHLLRARSFSYTDTERDFIARQCCSSHISFYLGGETAFSEEFRSGLSLLAKHDQFSDVVDRYSQHNRMEIVSDSLKKNLPLDQS